ncbi:hypothetical protein [Thermaurantiacus sp.]
MTLLPLGGAGRQLVLGTTQWGSEVDRATALALLDRFAGLGGQIVETAPSYPANGNPASYQLAISYLAEWLQSNRGARLSAIVRIGACDNLGGPDALLNPGFIGLSAEIWEGALGGALGCLAVQHDNRDQPDAIAQTVHAFKSLHEQGLAIGLSSVRRPDLYAAADPDLAASWLILGAQAEGVDETLATYRPHFPSAALLACTPAAEAVSGDRVQQSPADGWSGKALSRRLLVKLRGMIETDLRGLPVAASLPLWLLARARFDPELKGVIIGPRSVPQLDQLLAFWSRLGEADGFADTTAADTAETSVHVQ